MADNPAKPVVEHIPSVKGSVSAVGSANAPFVYFDGAPYYGYLNGVAMITLTAQRQIGVLADGSVANDLVVTGFLRANIPALVALKNAIEGILLMARPKPKGDLN